MTFGELHGLYNMLRRRLATHLGPKTPEEISIPSPAGTDDELSFIRLIGWGYALLQEDARVAVNFLKELPPISDSRKLLPHVGILRTWSSHSLSFHSENDINTLKLAQAWFRKACGTAAPRDCKHWEACWTVLSGELKGLLASLIETCDVLDNPPDGHVLVAKLGRRIDRDWKAFRFDALVLESAQRLGCTGIDVVSFRTRHLQRWRELISMLEDSELDRLLERRIEADLLTLIENSLPVSARESLQVIQIENPSELVAFLLALRHNRQKVGGHLPAIIEEAARCMRADNYDVACTQDIQPTKEGSGQS